MVKASVSDAWDCGGGGIHEGYAVSVAVVVSGEVGFGDRTGDEFHSGGLWLISQDGQGF